MKKALFKDSMKQIKNTHKRFISILLMAFLGVGFFAGIRAASPDMKMTIDNFYDNQSVYDFEIMSTLGLTDSDIEALKQIEGIDEVYGTLSKDVQIKYEDTEFVVKVHRLEENINKVVLQEGRLPENADECVVEQRFITSTKQKIGDYIEIDEQLEEDEESFFKEKKLKIVGIVQSPLYISSERGTSSLGEGSIDYYIYMSGENMISDVYTEIYATIDNKDLETGSKEYNEYIANIEEKIEEIKEERQNARYDEIVGEATEKLTDAENELNDKKKEAEEEFAKADKEITDAENEIEKAENEIASNETKANAEFKKAEQKIKDAKQELEASEKEFASQKEEANKQIESTKSQLEEQKSNLQNVNINLETLNAKLDEVNNQLENSEGLTDEKLNILNATKAELSKNITELTNTKNVLNDAIAQMESGIQEANNQLLAAENQITSAKQEIAKAEKELKANKTSTYNKIEDAKQELADGKSKLEDSKKEYNEKKADYETQIRDAEEELEDARKEISEIKKAKWYILDRDSNRGYNGFMQDTESIANIGKVFPIVFFVIAALISLTSMTRMVEEERVQIGTLKALGYSKLQIASKYLIYASLASIIGGVLGMIVGCYSLPPIVWMLYSMLYDIPNFVVQINWEYSSIGLICIFACIVGATLYAVWQELTSMPAVLMRPKSPKMGKRVLLEKIPFIWKRLNFSRKVTVRNIFRYKKRFLMTIIGICGCTALILTGFGLKDSISSLLSDQYGKIFKYDMQVGIEDDITDEDFNKINEFIDSKEEITNKVLARFTSADAIHGESQEAVQIIVPDDINNIGEAINILDKETEQTVILDNNKIAITDKVAEVLDVQEGSTIALRDSDGIEKEVTVGNIVENYIYHYIYMSKDLYMSLYDTEYENNVILIKTNGLTEDQESELAKQMIENEGVTGVSQVSNMASTMEDMMNSLNYVVVILIISSGLLAFVVLYNLSNVNISERIRELATIKVLGFYDKEVYKYVTRETVLLTIIGIALGLVGGYFLNSFILTTCETNVLRFNSIIKPLSYIYPIIITILFTWIVNRFTYFSLKKINMIESLKSVE